MKRLKFFNTNRNNTQSNSLKCNKLIHVCLKPKKYEMVICLLFALKANYMTDVTAYETQPENLPVANKDKIWHINK